MKRTRIATALGLLIFLLAMLAYLPPQAVHAQCDPAGGPCGPGDPGAGDKNKRPTPTDVPTRTPTATPTLIRVFQSGGGEGSPFAPASMTPTLDPSVYATARACWEAIYRKTPHPELPTASWGDIQVDAPQCIPTSSPTPVTKIFIPPVAGPVFVAPGVKNVLIPVVGISVLLAGLITIVRRLSPPGPPVKPPNPNKTK